MKLTAYEKKGIARNNLMGQIGDMLGVRTVAASYVYLNYIDELERSGAIVYLPRERRFSIVVSSALSLETLTAQVGSKL